MLKLKWCNVHYIQFVCRVHKYTLEQFFSQFDNNFGQVWNQSLTQWLVPSGMSIGADQDCMAVVYLCGRDWDRLMLHWPSFNLSMLFLKKGLWVSNCHGPILNVKVQQFLPTPCTVTPCTICISPLCVGIEVTGTNNMSSAICGIHSYVVCQSKNKNVRQGLTKV